MKNHKNTVAIFSKGIALKKEIKIFLNIDNFVFKPKKALNINLVVGWGNKENTIAAKGFAVKNQLDYYSLEDGFIHSSGQGVLGSQSCSMVKDSRGIYYDSTRYSDLEHLLVNENEKFSDELISRASKAITKIIKSNITKYNNGSVVINKSRFKSKKKVLVVDQTAGDMSLKYGYAGNKTFGDMLFSAVNENPDAQIIIKTHPDVIAGKKKGNFNLKELNEDVLVISELVNPLVLLKEIDIVYVATSQLGFEALMLGKEVKCFGVPFYAGWGLTDDRADKNLEVWKRRSQKRSLEEVFAAAYIQYTHYINPINQKKCELEEVIAYFERQNYAQLYSLPSQIYGINFTSWKKNHVRKFLKGKQIIRFVNSFDDANKEGFNKNSQLISWASKDQTQAKQITKKQGGVIWYMEDGFIRSTGLGTDLTAPASLVLDKTGIYYDPTQVSDLETLLQTKQFDEDELARANLLTQSLLKNELSKYNLGKSFDKSQLSFNSKQKLILIPGQVEDDASIKKGCVDINTNTDLIQSVRKNNPDSYVIYKPHPDVVSGNRVGKVAKSITDKHCDLVLDDTSITDCLAMVDEVHTMTSLVGFEALLRNLNVVCYGLPFYAGWGLTHDFHEIERRTRKLKLDELVHATLIDYPFN